MLTAARLLRGLRPRKHSLMDHAVARWSVLLAGLIVAGGAAWSAVGAMHSARGIAGPGITDAINPAWAALVLLGAFGVATVVAVIVGRLLNPIVGLFTLGAGLGVLAMRTGTIRDACFDGGSLAPLACEALVWALLVAIASIVVHRCAKDASAMVPVSAGGGAGGGAGGASGGGGGGASGGTIARSHGDAGLALRDALSIGSLKVAAIGAVAIIGIWLLVVSPLKGQAIGAAIVGGFLAGHVAKRALPDQSPVLLFAAPILFVAIAQLILSMSIVDPAAAFVHGSLPNLVVIMPLDLVAGSIVGVAIGIGLAKPPH